MSYLRLHKERSGGATAATRPPLRNSTSNGRVTRGTKKPSDERKSAHKLSGGRTVSSSSSRRPSSTKSSSSSTRKSPPTRSSTRSPGRYSTGGTRGTVSTTTRVVSNRSSTRTRTRTSANRSRSSSAKRKLATTTKTTPKPSLETDDFWRLKRTDFKIGALLATGAFSQVHLVWIQDTERTRKIVPKELFSRPLALKIVNKDNAVKKKQVRSLKSEKVILASASGYPFVVSFHGSFQDKENVYLVMEFVIGGEILTYLERAPENRFSPEVVRFYVAEIVATLRHLQKIGFVYRDLKPENILLGPDGHLQLVDFGFSKRLRTNERTYTMCGSIEYVAPEILLGEGHTYAVDYWSLGVLTYEMVTGRLPFLQVDTPREMFDQIRRMRGPRFPRSLNVPDELKDFIKRLLHKDPKQRLGSGPKGIAELVKHPWLAGVPWQDLEQKQVPAPIVPRFRGPDDVSNFADTMQHEEHDALFQGFDGNFAPHPTSPSSHSDNSSLLRADCGVRLGIQE